MAQVQIAPELESQLKAFGLECYNHWMSTTSAEQRAAGEARGEQYKNDPSYAETHMNRVKAEFAECDADGDGRLSQAEFLAFFAKQREQRAREGADFEPKPNQAEEAYALFNQISAEGEGFTLDEYFAAYRPMMVAMAEAKAAAGQ